MNIPGTTTKAMIEDTPSGRVNVYLTVRVLFPTQKEIADLIKLVGYPRGTFISEVDDD